LSIWTCRPRARRLVLLPLSLAATLVGAPLAAAVPPPPPTILTGPADGAIVDSNPLVKYTLAAPAPGATLAWSLNRPAGQTGGLFSQLGTGQTVNLADGVADGTYTFSARQVDLIEGDSPLTVRTVQLLRPPTFGPASFPLPTNGASPIAILFSADATWSFKQGGNLVHSGTGLSASLPVGLGSDGLTTLEARKVFGPDSLSVLNSVSFTLDRTPPPGLAITSGPAEGAVVNAVPTFGFAATEGTLTWSLALGPTVVKTGTTGTAALAPVTDDGTYTFTAIATDAAGNASSVPRIFRIDRKAPTAPTFTPEVLTVVTTPPSTTLGGGAEPVSYRWQLDGGAIKSTAEVNLAGLADGDHTLVAWAVDQGGNESPKATRPFKLDRLAPDPPKFSAIAAALKKEPQVTISSQANATILWNLTGPKALSGQGAAPLTTTFTSLPDGEYTLTARARTPAGNTSAPATTTFKMDTQAPPAPAITSGPKSDRGGSRPTFVWTGEGAASFVWQVSLGDLIVQGPTTTSDKTVRLSKLLTGHFVFQVQQVDSAGNVGPATQYAFSIKRKIKAVGRPVIAKLYGPLFPRPGLVVTQRSQLELRWVYRAGRKSRFFNVQVFDASGKKILSAFPTKTRYTLPVGLAKRGRRLYWQVWPYWEKGGYARKPLGVSFFDISRTVSKLEG
jgi:large repetitive protein